ncbi:MAG: anthranilate synthase component II, partial [Bacteroidetes bacterium]
LPLHGVQFHPESIMTPQGRQMLANWLAFAKASQTAQLSV